MDSCGRDISMGLLPLLGHLVQHAPPPSSAHGRAATYRYNLSTLADRLLGNPDACVIHVRITEEAGEEVICTPRMEEMFVSAEELKGMVRQFGVLIGYVYCTFVMPEDRKRLMQAMASVSFEQGARIQLDTVVRCCSRHGEILRCLASVGFHADAQGTLIILRLWPLTHRSLLLLPMAGGGSTTTTSTSSTTCGSTRAEHAGETASEVDQACEEEEQGHEEDMEEEQEEEGEEEEQQEEEGKMDATPAPAQAAPAPAAPPSNHEAAVMAEAFLRSNASLWAFPYEFQPDPGGGGGV